MNCTEVFNYIFESFNSNNIDYAIIHSYQYLPDRFDSDIDTAINVPNIKDAIKLLDDTLVGTGWRVIQFWRHENYAADCIISNDDEFLQVDFCTHYERNGRVVIPVQELLDGKRMYKNFYIPKPQTEFTYVLVKKILKKVFSDGSKQRLTALWKAMNEKERQETKAGLKRFIAEDQINEILECVDSLQYDLIDLERAHQLLKKKTSNVADNLHYKVFDLKRRFERIVHPTGLFIVLLGALSYDEVNSLYDNADVFVFTSLRDTSGNVVLEAMSHGLPVIAINHHGVGEIVTDETGIRIDPVSYDSVKSDLAKAIEKYAKNPDLMKQLGLAGRKRLEMYYSWENNAKVLQNIYERIAMEK